MFLEIQVYFDQMDVENSYPPKPININVNQIVSIVQGRSVWVVGKQKNIQTTNISLTNGDRYLIEGWPHEILEQIKRMNYSKLFDMELKS